MKYFKISLLTLFLNLSFFLSFSLAEKINQIQIIGNERISNETIKMFSDVEIDQVIKTSNLDIILKNLYKTNYFNLVSVNFIDGILSIKVEEAPLIDEIIISGLKAKKFKELIRENLILKPRNSFNDYLLSEEIKSIKSQFRDLGFYFIKIDPYIETLDNNLVNIEYKIELGEKAKISKISFIGDKVYKDKKLKSIILSEEYKFWKFISGKKYLKPEILELDKRLLKNFYLNKGYYNVKINSSFAKLIDGDEFELIFNIDANKKIFFNDLSIILPNDFDKTNYVKLDNLFQKIKGEPYSINSVEKILNQIDAITLEDEFKTIKATVKENIIESKLNIDFVIEESEKFFVEKINILGNNITRENVIRNQLELDEGDPFSEILAKKSENNIKSLNFFKNVKSEIIDGKNLNSKIINLLVEEKATGEISAGAGAGTEGGTFFFSVKENNYLGKGLEIDMNTTLSAERFKGLLSITDPNYKNSDKSVFVNAQAIEIDQLTDFGYKTNKTGFELGTNFEYLQDLYLGLSTSTFIEKIETDSTASTRQKAQAGNYLDSFLKINFNIDKRNQKFKTTDGYTTNYGLSMPLVSDTNTLTNSFNYKIYSEIYENNVSSLSILLKASTSLSNDDIKLTERLFLPSSKLRGFESGKVGPKDGNDFIGGNYISAINLQSTLPILFQNSQNLDAVIFFDAANIWGVDYDSSISDNSKIRSSIGIGIDWMTVIGPLNFSLAEVISKNDTDVEQSFRFNLGTTF
jgi:outer membrane protein insertion porin family